MCECGGGQYKGFGLSPGQQRLYFVPEILKKPVIAKFTPSHNQFEVKVSSNTSAKHISKTNLERECSPSIGSHAPPDSLLRLPLVLEIGHALARNQLLQLFLIGVRCMGVSKSPSTLYYDTCASTGCLSIALHPLL